jgi:hypothetical protein
MQGKRRWFTLLVVASIALTGIGTAAVADSGTEGEFLAKINATRASAGLGQLQVDGGLRSHARVHTQDMMDANEIFHSGSGELGAAGGTGWDQIGENVGRGQSPTSLHNAFMESPGHKKNILGDYNYVGIGTGSKDGYLYVTVVFMKKGSTASPTTTEAPPSPTTTEASSGETKPPATTTTTATAGTAGTTAAPSAPTTTVTTIATTTTTLPATTTLVVPPDKAVTPGQSCIEANRYFQLCHD